MGSDDSDMAGVIAWSVRESVSENGDSGKKKRAAEAALGKSNGASQPAGPRDQRRGIVRPPSTIIIWPVLKGKSPRARAATALPTSSG